MLICLLLAGSQALRTIVVELDLQDTRPISPYIYGANQPDWDKAHVPYTLTRQGGNRMTAYNWETNASNAGNDWHMQNDGYLGKTDEPGWTVRTYLEDTEKHGAAAIVTVPCAGYVAADKDEDGDVGKTPDYIHKRFLPAKASKPGGRYQYPPDTKDGVVYEDEMVAWVEGIKRPKTPVWYSLDNEPDLWHSTHARLWPQPVRYADILRIGIEFATAIKHAAPKALVFGPANYGWQGMRTFQDAPDAQGRDFLDFYLSGMKAASTKAGKRLLDVLDVHWYPEAQGEGKRITTDTPGGRGLSQARMQAPRSLWDPTYVEKSWITDNLGGKPIMLLDYLKKRIDRSYPGTKLAVTEYNYGGGREASGMVAQADVLGVFGRSGVFAACNWGADSNQPAVLAGFRAFLDYDGKGSRFGDTAVATRVAAGDPALFSAYASRDKDRPGRWVFVLINRSEDKLDFSLPVKGKASAFAADFGTPPHPDPVKTTVRDGRTVVTASPASVVTIEVVAH